MKCIKNVKTGDIKRVDDLQANNLVGNTWQYIPKSEWKAVTRVVSEKQEVESEKKEHTISEKALRRKKLKEKQRQ